MEITFEKLPQAVQQLSIQVQRIERLLLEKSNTNQKSEDAFLTIRQTADLLSLAVPTIYGYVQRKEIPFSKKGKRLYFDKSEILQWIKDGKRPPVTNLDRRQFFTNKRSA